jgi:hypothetical protein
MAEERTLGLARALEHDSEEELSKEELQRRMEEARDSISHTVTEIKETVAHQYQAVKETLDWREQVKRRPVAWSLGALGVGFVVGYRIAGALKSAGNGYHTGLDYLPSEPHAYAARPVMGEVPATATGQGETSIAPSGIEEEQGPRFMERFKDTPAYGRLRQEAASLGDRFIDELSKTAQQLIIPAVVSKLGSWIEEYLPERTRSSQSGAAGGETGRTKSSGGSTYQPVLERNAI